MKLSPSSRKRSLHVILASRHLFKTHVKRYYEEDNIPHIVRNNDTGVAHTPMWWAEGLYDGRNIVGHWSMRCIGHNLPKYADVSILYMMEVLQLKKKGGFLPCKKCFPKLEVRSQITELLAKTGGNNGNI